MNIIFLLVFVVYFSLDACSNCCRYFMLPGLTTELDAVTTYSEIVPDTVVFDDFEKYNSPLSSF